MEQTKAVLEETFYLDMIFEWQGEIVSVSVPIITVEKKLEPIFLRE